MVGKLSEELSEIISELLMIGYTLYEISESWDISYHHLCLIYKPNNKDFFCIKQLKLNGKREAYHSDEMKYGSDMPKYDFNELSRHELYFYYYNLKTNN